MTTELYKVHRPKDFTEVIGQKEVLDELKGMAKAKKFPHTLLFTGPSGCGKTTIARICAAKLGCHPRDLKEINAADDRGIEMVRDIKGSIGLTPLAGPVRVWIVDECFPAGTPVSTPYGDVAIEDIREGDVVHNVRGIGGVLHRFVNKVELDRIVRVYFDDGSSRVTTKQHEFLTLDGWRPAIDLEGCYTFRPSCNLLHKYEDESEEKSEVGNSMRVLPSAVRAGGLLGAAPDDLLLEELRHKKAKQGEGVRRIQGSSVQGMRDDYASEYLVRSGVLQSVVCGEAPEQASGIQGKTVQQGSSREDLRVQKEVQSNGAGSGSQRDALCSDESGQSDAQTVCSGYYEGDQNNQRNSAPVAGQARRERAVNSTTENIVERAGQSRPELGSGVCGTDGYSAGTGYATPHQLQDRYSTFDCKVGDRSGRGGAFYERRYFTRCQEDSLSRRVGVVRVEVYEPGNNDKSFESVVTDKCRDRGYVEFYDIEVEGHPSYFVGGIPVHNCHQLTPQAQESFLKTLEDTPPHVYFFLCTSEPTKLKASMITRSTEIKVRSLKASECKTLIDNIAAKEGKKFSEDVCSKIFSISEGSPRKALVLLNQILNMPEEEDQIHALEKADTKRDAFELCKVLLNTGSSWKEYCDVLKTIESTEIESCRWMVLGYMNRIALSNGKATPRAISVIESFMEPFYDSKAAGLTQACYFCFSSGK